MRTRLYLHTPPPFPFAIFFLPLRLYPVQSHRILTSPSLPLRRLIRIHDRPSLRRRVIGIQEAGEKVELYFLHFMDLSSSCVLGHTYFLFMPLLRYRF